MLKLKKDNIFKIRSYQKVARAVEALQLDVEQLVAENRLGEIPGVGEAITRKIAELVTTGKLGYVAGGRSWTCPTYVKNLVDGIVKACFEENAAGEAFIITDGLDIDWRTFTENLADALGVKRPKLSIPFGPAYGLALAMEGIYSLFRISRPPFLTRYRISNGGRDYHFSIEKAGHLLEFRPAVDLDEAVDRTVNWYRDRQST